jgi:hypothetical protein
MFRFPIFRLIAFLLCAMTLALAAPSAALAKASCWCRLGPVSSPYKDFGAIATWGGQSGHDSTCHDLCSQTVTGWMATAANKSAVCQAANGGSLAAYSCVGTRPWGNAWTGLCPAGNTPAPGALAIYDAGYTSRTMKINNVMVPVNANTQPNTVIMNTPLFTTFFFVDPLNFHVQSWTYTAKLYRDNVLVETLVRKSPTVSKFNAVATFTQQPNAFVHGHVWKIEWSYAGPNQANGATSYSIF